MVTGISRNNIQIYCCCSCFQQVTLLMYFTLSHLSACPGTRGTKSRLPDGFMFMKGLCKITSAHGLWMCQAMQQEETRVRSDAWSRTGAQISPVDSQGPDGLWAYLSEGYCDFLSLLDKWLVVRDPWTKEWMACKADSGEAVTAASWLALSRAQGVKAWRPPSLGSRVPESWVRVPLQNIFGEKPGEQ